MGPEAGPRPIPTTLVGGFPTAALTRRQLAGVMAADCLEARSRGRDWLPKLVFSSNGQGIALAGGDRDFAAAMARADIIHADGMPVVFASRLSSHPCPERIVTTDFFHDAAQTAQEMRLRFFMLGASEEQNARACREVARLYPRLALVGRQHGYFPPEENDAVCARIRDSRADVLWVGLGKPKQEFWAVANRRKLAGVGWIKTCGGLYSYLAGDATRAPRWMQEAALEWLYRMMQDPARLGWRYLTTNPYALYRLVRHTGRRGGKDSDEAGIGHQRLSR